MVNKVNVCSITIQDRMKQIVEPSLGRTKDRTGLTNYWDFLSPIGYQTGFYTLEKPDINIKQIFALESPTQCYSLFHPFQASEGKLIYKREEKQMIQKK